MDDSGTKSTKRQNHVQFSNTEIPWHIKYVYNQIPSVLIVIMWAVALIFFLCSNAYEGNRYLCDNHVYYYRPPPCSNNCMMYTNFNWYRLISELFLQSIVWRIGLSVTGRKWICVNLWTTFFLIYPFLDNKFEVKIADICGNIYYSLNTTLLSSEEYVVQQAVFKPDLFRFIAVLVMSCSTIVYIFCILKVYQRKKFRNRLKIIPKRRRNLNHQSRLTQRSQSRRLSIDTINEKNLLTLILTKITVIEQKMQEKENEEQDNTFIDWAGHNPGKHLIFIPAIVLVKFAWQCYLVISMIGLIGLSIYIIFVPSVLDDNNIYIKNLLRPIKNNNDFIRKQILHFFSLITMLFSARALKYAPNKKRNGNLKDTLQYVRSVFLFVDVATKITIEPLEQRHSSQNRRPATDV